MQKISENNKNLDFEDFFFKSLTDGGDIPADYIKRYAYIQTTRRDGLLESYIKSRLTLHLHFTSPRQEGFGSERNFTPEQGCIILKWPIGEKQQGPSFIPHSALDTDAMRASSSQGDGTMLVPVGQFTQMPQETLISLPCSERLQGSRL